VECLNLLWNLVEASPIALNIFNQMSLVDVVLPLLGHDVDPAIGVNSNNICTLLAAEVLRKIFFEWPTFISQSWAV
jgi:hypothetical protein